jgi:hypothetical protein
MSIYARDSVLYWQTWIVFRVSDHVMCMYGLLLLITHKQINGFETLFHLPQKILCILPNLSDMFTMPPHQEGTSNEHPIVTTLPSKVTVHDFRAFILFLMPALAHDMVWDVTAWIGVLRIANWAMHKSTCDGAIRHLNLIIRTWPPTQLYWFAQEHRVLEWHIHAVKELLGCPEAMSACKVDDLGSDIAVRILNIRLCEE